MKRIAFLLLLVSSSCFARVVVDLHDVPLRQLAYVMFAEAMGVQYAMDGSFREGGVTIHVELPDNPQDREAVVLPLMASLGVAVERQGDVYLLSASKSTDADKDVPFVYRPRWRSVPYLVDLV